MTSITIFHLLATIVLVVGSYKGVSGKNIALETNEVADHFISTSINFIFDMFLKHFTSKLAEEGKTQIEIGGFERRFTTRVLSMDIEGAIEVEDGWCGNISTLQRTGDADMTKAGGDIILTTHLGLNDLKIDFNKYDISLLGVHQNGKIHVTVGKNSLWLKLNAQLKPVCLITLSEFKIERLESIEVDITNLGAFENLTDEITSWVINIVKMKLTSEIEEVIFPKLSKALKNADLCHYLPI